MSTNNNITKSLNKAINNIVNNSSNKNIPSPKKGFFSNPYLILGSFVGFIIVIYLIIKLVAKKSKYKKNYTFYGKELTEYEPIFKDEFDEIEECAKRCKQDFNCDGITYQISTGKCTGTKNGHLRPDINDYISWVKTRKTSQITVEKTTLATNVEEKERIESAKIPFPKAVNSFTFSFWITVRDWYENFHSWKHVFHKGTEINDRVNYTNWDDVVDACPEQCPGVWLSPFTNNIRVVVTTRTKESAQNIPNHPNIKPCKDNLCYIKSQIKEKEGATRYVKSLEFHDIKNIDINRPVFIIIRFRKHVMEIYINGKLHKTIRLAGEPIFNYGNLQIMFPKTFKGYLQNINYYPEEIDKDEILKLYQVKPETDF